MSLPAGRGLCAGHVHCRAGEQAELVDRSSAGES
jgi:hypothetical protein